MTSAAGAPFATAHRMIDGVHGDAAVVRPHAEPARAPRLANGDVLVIGVGHLADGGTAIEVHESNLATREANLPPGALFGHELRGDAGGATELAPLALLQLDVV